MKGITKRPEARKGDLQGETATPNSVNEIFELMHAGTLSKQEAVRALRRLKRERHSWFERYVKALAS